MRCLLLLSLVLTFLACKSATDTTPTGELTGVYQFGGTLTRSEYQRGYSYSPTSYSMVITGSLLITTAGSELRTIYENSTNPEANGIYQVVLSGSSTLALMGTDQFRDHTDKIQGTISRISDKEIALTRSVVDSAGSSFVYSKTLSIHAVKN